MKRAVANGFLRLVRMAAIGVGGPMKRMRRKVRSRLRYGGGDA